MRKDVAESFWSKVDKRDNGCWIWTGGNAGRPGSYGRFKLNGKQIAAHRVAWIITHGEIPFGLWCLHHCDVRACCNPEHIYLGTLIDNTNDAINRNRYLRRLTDEQVISIRRESNAGTPHSSLAEKYGVTRSMIQAITSGRRYKSVGGPVGKRVLKVWHYNTAQAQRGRKLSDESKLKMSLRKKESWASGAYANRKPKGAASDQ